MASVVQVGSVMSLREEAVEAQIAAVTAEPEVGVARVAVEGVRARAATRVEQALASCRSNRRLLPRDPLSRQSQAVLGAQAAPAKLGRLVGLAPRAAGLGTALQAEAEALGEAAAPAAKVAAEVAAPAVSPLASRGKARQLRPRRSTARST